MLYAEATLFRVSEIEPSSDGPYRALWQSLIDHTPTLILLLGVDGTVHMSNRALPVAKGVEFVGRNLYDALNPERHARMSTRIAEVCKSRAAMPFEGEGERADGTPGWYSGHYIPIFGDGLPDGEVERVLIMATDVTDQRRANEELRANETRFRALVENGTDCMILTDASGATPYASPAVTRILGYDVEEMRRTRAVDIVHPDDVPLALQARSAPPGTCVEGTFRVRHKDGSWRWLEGSATNLLDDPSVRAIVSNRHDITGRRAVEEQMRFQAAVLSQVNEAVLASDLTARITYWNEAATKLYGYSSEEALGRDGTELLQTEWPNSADIHGHSDALRSVGSWRGEMRHTTKSGERILVEASIRILRDASGNPVAGISVMQDVTAKRRLEEQLRHSQKMEALGVFAGGVAHDFNNLLTVILGCTEVPLRSLPAEHANAQSLREVISAAQRCAELTRKLLAFSRKQIMRLAPLDLSNTVRDAAKLLSRIVGEDVQITLRCDAGPLVIRGDNAQLEQILFNLATNARQAMPAGGQLAITARRVVLDDAFVDRNPWARAGRFAELTVGDSGVGMDTATLARIFEPFFTTKEQGTGFGLATVYGIVRQHAGFVHVDSLPGRGATFRVFFPLHEQAGVLAEAPKPEPAARGGNETILVAEDSASLRALLTSTLTGFGYRVLAVEDGEQAVREYEQHALEVALVVLDVVMPKLGGLDAYARMRAVRPDVKVLLMTGYAPDAIQLGELLDQGRLRLLEKPFSSQTLGMSVRETIDASA